MSVYCRLLVISISIFCFNSWAVFGGIETDTEMKKSLVYILFKKGVCTGVLLENRFVLSAAHCKDMLGEPERATVTTNNPDLKKCSTSRVIDYQYTPDAKPIFPRKVHAPDLVLLELETPLCSGKAAKIMNEELLPGDVLTLTGYGGGSGVWYNSRQIEIEVISSKGIMELNTSDSPMFKTLLSLSKNYYNYALPVEHNTTSCTGDSGGPLFANNNGTMEVYAINGAVFPNNSLGADHCNNGYLNLITPIAPYYEWIQDKIADKKSIVNY